MRVKSRRLVVVRSFRKTSLKWTIASVVLIFLSGCASQSNINTPTPTPTPIPSSTPTPTSTVHPTSITYKNTKYGFNFTLPLSWTGYSIVSGKWEGNDVKSGAISETGAMLSIRHPQWTSNNVRQDIPIFILSIAQWNALTNSDFHIGAAPIPPSELGRNSKYVFALPARYNFAFPTGYQEVQQILDSRPLHAN